MPKSSDMPKLIDAPLTKEQSEFEALLLSEPEKPKKLKMEWETRAIDKFFEINEASKGMALLIFIDVSTKMKTPELFFAAIKKKMRTLKKQLNDIGLYDNRFKILCSVMQHRQNELYTELMKEPGKTKIRDEDLIRIFELNQKEYLTVLQLACEKYDEIGNSPDLVCRLIHKHDMNAPLALPVPKRAHMPKTLCEYAVTVNNFHAFWTFRKLSNIKNQWNAIKLAFELERGKLLYPYSADPITFLNYYLNLSKDPHRLFIRSVPAVPDMEMVKFFLNRGVIYDAEIKSILAKYLALDIQLKTTAEFLEQTPNSASLSERLFSSDREPLNLLMNLKDTNGNTVFYTLFKTLMEADDRHFERLLYCMKHEKVKIDIDNPETESIFSLKLSNDQKACLLIDGHIKKANLSWESVNFDPLNKEEYETLHTELDTRIQTIVKLLEPLPQETVSNDFYLDTLALCLEYKDNEYNFRSELNPIISTLEACIMRKTNQYLWKAINDIMLYLDTREEPILRERLNHLWNSVLNRLKENQQTLNFSPEEFDFYKINNPYKVALSLNTQNQVPKILALLRAGVPHDIVVDKNGNSLLHAVIGLRNTTLTKEIIKHSKCPKFLDIPNAEGYTPLHKMFLIPTDNQSINLLLKSLKRTTESIRRKCKWQTETFAIEGSAFLPLALSCTIQYQDNPSEKENIRKWFIERFYLAIDLLREGAHCPSRNKDNELFLYIQKCFEISNKLNGFLWDAEHKNPFMVFEKEYNALLNAWDMVEKIEQGIGTFDFQQFNITLDYQKTPRYFDDKTMFEVVFGKYTALEQELSRITSQLSELELKTEAELKMEAELKTQTKKKIKNIESKIKDLKNVLSLWLLNGVSIGNISEEFYQYCFEIGQEKLKVEQLQSEWLGTQQEAKELNETTMVEQTEKFFNELNKPKQPALLELECYPNFISEVFGKMAKDLFLVDEQNNLKISEKTLELSYSMITKAMEFSKPSSVSRATIAQLYNQIGRHISKKPPFACLQESLSQFNPVLETEMREKGYTTALDQLFATHGLNLAKPSADQSSKPKLVCVAIIEALKRAQEYKKELRMSNEALKAKIAKLENSEKPTSPDTSLLLSGSLKRPKTEAPESPVTEELEHLTVHTAEPDKPLLLSDTAPKRQKTEESPEREDGWSPDFS